MSIFQLLFSFKGRARRRDWWLASIGLFAFVTAAEFAAHQLLTGRPPEQFFEERPLRSDPYSLAQWALMGLAAWPSLAISVKRWHDRNRPAWVAVMVLAENYGQTFLQSQVGGGSGWLSYIAMMVIAFGLAIWQVIECGCLDSTGNNTYGPSPKGDDTALDVF